MDVNRIYFSLIKEAFAVLKILLALKCNIYNMAIKELRGWIAEVL